MGKALDAIAKKIESAKQVRVGFLENATYPDGTKVAMVAAIQNFGAPAKGIPPRPFFTNMVKKNKAQWGEQLAQVLKANDYDAKKSLGQMGEEMAGELVDEIIATDSPALSPVTLLLRERFGNNPQEITFADVQQARRDVAGGTAPNVTGTQSKPLIWTGHMESSVQYDVDGDVRDAGTK